MGSRFFFAVVLCSLVATAGSVFAQEGWPKSIKGADGSIIRIFHPQPDSFFDNNMQFRADFSIVKQSNLQPLSGSFQASAVIETDRSKRSLNIVWASVTGMRLSWDADSLSAAFLRETIECGLPDIGTEISLDRLIASMGKVPAPRDASQGLRHDPPRIIYWPRLAMLICIDGIPRRKRNNEYALNSIANTPFTILESSDGWFYCYGGRHWYFAPSPEGPWQLTTYLAPDLPHVASLIDQANDAVADDRHEAQRRNAAQGKDGVTRDLLFTNKPAELLCSDGPPQFAGIQGTRLLYATNSDADLLLDSLTHDYYVLFSGRWFAAKTLSGPWRTIAADSLSPELAHIPERSVAARVLACVPGTAAARAAVIDAQIPQTVIVDRHRATTYVSYDGGPRFASIPGTHLAYVYNTASVVIRARDNFYCLDKGVWFQSRKTSGPWVAATRRPEEIEAIPTECPVYFCKYSYIYGSNDSVVYAGFTAGYLQSYIDGKTLVYGTGYHYPVYAGEDIYPRAVTYGFGMWYSPGSGWALGRRCSPDWLNTSAGWGTGGWNGGWFGPVGYRPPYIRY